MMKKLYVFDIDRTIKPFIGPIPLSTVHAIKKLQRNPNVYIALATGRTYDEAKAVAKKLNISLLVTSGGSEVYVDGNCIFQYQENFEKEIIHLLERKPLSIIVCEHGYFSFHFSKWLKRFGIFRFLFSKQSSGYHFLNMIGSVQEIQSLVDFGKVHKIYTFGTYQGQMTYSKIIGSLKSHEFENKALAVNQLIDCLTDVSELIAFGDSRNDLALFEMADRCYAMKHGHHQLQAIATQIIPLYGGIKQVLESE